MKKTLLILAAGMASRYGGGKQVEEMGPHGEMLMEYSIHDARQAGFSKLVFIIKRNMEEVFHGLQTSGRMKLRHTILKGNSKPCPKE